MGDTGPCGPCSEIFYDHGDKIAGGPPGSRGRGRRPASSRSGTSCSCSSSSARRRRAVDLPKPSVDTGMGLERVAAVVQGVTSNYDTDLFKALIAASESRRRACRRRATTTASHARHRRPLRATTLPHRRRRAARRNEGRGYVLRRIMRRAMRHAHLLGATEPFMYRLVPALVHEMGDTYPRAAARAAAHRPRRSSSKRSVSSGRSKRGLELLEDATGDLPEGRDAVRRHRVQALRHLRLSRST